jgi:hypothetical protein
MESDRRGIALVAYTGLFAIFAWPWLGLAGDTVPVSLGHPADERLVAYILAWGARALATNPLASPTSPVGHPKISSSGTARR